MSFGRWHCNWPEILNVQSCSALHWLETLIATARGSEDKKH